MPKRVLPVRSLPLILGFVLLTLVVGAAALLVELQQSGNDEVRRNLVIQTKLAEVLAVVQGAETGQRGYLLTGDRQYLKPYEDAIARVGGKLSQLEAEPGVKEQFHEPLERLLALVRQKLAEMRETISRREAGDAVGALAIIHGDSGETLGRQIRDVVNGMLTTEKQVLNEEMADAQRLANALRLGVTLSVIIIIGLAAVTILQTRRRAATIIRQRDELQAANEALLVEKATREAAEEQMRQMQKMEALGQLTGGVAHDFNNMLAVMMSSLELMQMRLEKGDTDIQRFVGSAMDAAQRAATLTQRLLAFSRQQSLAPTGLDPNELIAGMSELLRRTLGTDIEVESVLAGGVWNIHADRAQLENVIVNLCINARDAMPEGGMLTIETANAALDDAYARENADVRPGQYVLIGISDTGAGMTDDVLRRAFDPFFTTKEVGRGTGLGLSQVYGFVKQSGGHIKIYSELGQGTSVKIYLPRNTRATTDVSGEKVAGPLPTGSEEETVLVVEDEARVRDLTVTALGELGYTVVAADGAAEALRHLDRIPDIRLLFTDIVMPEVNGRRLAEEALRRRPDLKVLYTTGFTRNAAVNSGVVDQDVPLLQKPFTLEELAAKVRMVLGDGAAR